MYGDIHKFVRGCLACASHGGTSWRRCAPLQSIPVGGPFERVVSTSWKCHKQRDVICEGVQEEHEKLREEMKQELAGGAQEADQRDEGRAEEL